MTALPRLDRIDRRILETLQVDGRITNQALAEQVALSPSACLARLRRLETAGVIEGYGARLNPWSLDASLKHIAAHGCGVKRATFSFESQHLMRVASSGCTSGT